MDIKEFIVTMWSHTAFYTVLNGAPSMILRFILQHYCIKIYLFIYAIKSTKVEWPFSIHHDKIFTQKGK